MSDHADICRECRGSTTAPDPLEQEVDRLRGEVARLKHAAERTVWERKADLDAAEKCNAVSRLAIKQRNEAVAENEAKAAVIAALLKKAVFYLDRAKDFSADGQGDSLIRADLQRELFVIARGGK
jgi:hypothetical protein